MEIERQGRGKNQLFIEHMASQYDTIDYVWRMTKRVRRHYDRCGLDGSEYHFDHFQGLFGKSSFMHHEVSVNIGYALHLLL